MARPVSLRRSLSLHARHNAFSMICEEQSPSKNKRQAPRSEQKSTKTERTREGACCVCTYIEALDFHDLDGRRRLLPPVVNVFVIVVVLVLGAPSKYTFRNRSSDDRRWCHHDGKTWRYRVLLQQLVLVLLLPLLLRAAPQQCVTLMPGHVRPRWRIAISIVHRFLIKNPQGGRERHNSAFVRPQTGQRG